MVPDKALSHESLMQLHLMEINDGGPLLLQILWGRMISVVIYRRKQVIRLFSVYWIYKDLHHERW